MTAMPVFHGIKRKRVGSRLHPLLITLIRRGLTSFRIVQLAESLTGEGSSQRRELASAKFVARVS